MSLQSQYHADLQELRANEACTFLLALPNFEKWYGATGSEWLIILGGMGCGKTIAMTFIVDELRRRNEHELPQPKICYHYCRNDETGKIGYILSTLILSLLEQLSGLKKTFHEWYKMNQTSGILDPARDTRKLGEFLQTVLEKLDRPLFIVIDGLDECDRASRKTLLGLLKTVSQKTPRLKILLSSRPEKEILDQLKDASTIDLGSDHQRDAAIVRYSVENQLSYLSEDVRVLVIETLSRLARGSAIWTRMTVKLIEIRRIEEFGPMRNFLEQMQLPERLSDLYVSMMSRYSSDDPENMELATIALKLLAVACRPFSIQELAWAVALAAAQHKINSVSALAQRVDQQRVMNLIHPFITRTDFSDSRKRQIRLVHQSVKEFIIQRLPLAQTSATLSVTGAHQQAETMESFILNVCIDYLLLDEIGSFHLFSDTQVAIDELPQEVDLFEDTKPHKYDASCSWEEWEENMIRYDPDERGFGCFFVYAASHWLQHFGAVHGENLPQLTKIENLCQAGSTRLHNWIKQNCRPDCVIKARFEFESHLYDPLGITALYGSDAMLCNMLEHSNFDEDKFLPSPAIAAADQILRWGRISRLGLLFSKERFSDQLRSLDFFRLVIRRWSETSARHDDWNVAFDLVNEVLDALIEEQWGSELLCIAAGAGCMPVVQHLLEGIKHKSKLKTELLRGKASIGEAVLGNHIEVVKCLLEQEGFETHLQYTNMRGENVLHLASKTCNPAVMRLLVPHFQKQIHQTDCHGDTALMRIIKSYADSQNRCESAKILLLSQVGTEDVSYLANNPLQVAVQLGDTEMCRILIRDGQLNPNSVLTLDDDGLLVLREKPRINEEAILRLLQEMPSPQKP